MSLEVVLFIALALILLAAGITIGRKSSLSLSGSVVQTVPVIEPINFAEPSDKSIQQMMDQLPVTPETVKAYLNVAKTLRQKGQYDQSIMVYQHLFGRANLAKVVNQEIQLHLAQDYYNLGLSNRSESLLMNLVKENSVFRFKAITELVKIYEQQKDWQNCINWGKQFGRKISEQQKKALSHHFCELAEVDIRKRAYASAEGHLAKALSENKQSFRAWLLYARLMLLWDHPKTAMKYLQKAIHANPVFIAEVFSFIDQQDITSFARDVREMIHAISGLEKMPSVMADKLVRDKQLLLSLGRQEINSKVVQLLINQADLTNVPADLAAIIHWADKHLVSHTSHQCSHCGFELNKLEWQCPSCKSWETVADKLDWEAQLSQSHRKVF
ncbi:hypothetical protein [Gynuella sunshinyii]|uniref:Putative N-acetylglucosaminyl transferase n=1 Tax=Gynuella sunshinyii YC6258 TaxID=1445510 RepID=A0A0C5VNJ4_9GAMM|nr:hypothetical protein [Gynuella sunshinyii]AJQ95886.1 putative N-acetylglucosaminyl transferase [Gynuella sunshinyii YC6258]